MKKLLFLAIILAAALTTAEAKKKAKKDAPKPTVELKTSSDSLSYAAGYANTQGLLPYLIQQFQMDTTYMADFVQGFRDMKEKVNDPRFIAYTTGTQIAKMVEDRMIVGMTKDLTDTPDTLVRDAFYRGFEDAVLNDSSRFRMADAAEYFRNGLQANKEAKDEKLYGENRRAGQQFLEANKTKPGVKTTASGLQYKILTEGIGPCPTAKQEVSVKYEGRLVDGKVFDSSYSRKDSIANFRVNQVIKGWTEALTMMPMGSKWEVYIPYNLAYGEREMGNIKPFSALIFTVELAGIKGVNLPKDTPLTKEEGMKKAIATQKAAKLTPAKKTTAKKK